MVELWRAFGGLIPLFFMITLIVIVSVLLFPKRSVESKKLFLNTLFMLTIIGILLITIFPSRYGQAQPRIINYVPFVGMYDIMFHSVDITVPIRNLGFNILLFVPFGFFLSWRKYSYGKLLLNVTLKGLFLSFVIEMFQYIIPMGRSADVDDLILNTFGAFLGYAIWRMLYNISPNIFGLPNKLKRVKGESF
ncbi:VanZ family protein [Bacillus thuringiensis]|uniref:VanZ family protein n=1 Tax=Bacillus thuringiensis TaxID=1428 RepID=UPI0022492F03|nr:VanZ family protein [Bacillus thuringiensis]